jgi:hypothetical protein
MNNLTQEAHPGPLYRIDIAGVRHVAAAVLAAQSGYCRDYIARLARQRRIAGRQVGRQWYIEERSFWAFVTEQEIRRGERRILLSAERRRERQAVSGPSYSL